MTAAIASPLYIFRTRRDAAIALLTPLAGHDAAALAVSVLELSHNTNQLQCAQTLISCGVQPDEAMRVLRALGYSSTQPDRCHRCRKPISPRDRACFGRGEDAGKVWCCAQHWTETMNLQHGVTT